MLCTTELSAETILTAPEQAMYVAWTKPELMEGSALIHSLPPWAVPNGEWRGGSNSIQGAGVKNPDCRY